ncbi:MAG: cation acetate symporter [Planctomycetia bacterium]|nr:cation acetate symporter [Planctomycetia bacterium]
MIYERSTLAVAIFAIFVGITLGLSFYLGRRAKSASGYFAAGGGIHWFVNGIAFAGDYLSAASFLGICGMIAFYGYDGFLYSIGYLAGWIVALFVVAEPLKRMGKFTFADALDSRFQSRGIKISAAISTLAVSIFYLIPQMVGAGALIKPLLGFSHATGVITVGAVVILIVTTAGMVSTTYVQFIKGSLLVVFSTVLVVMILNRGFEAPRSDLPGLPGGWIVGITSVEELNQKLVERGEAIPPTGSWKGRPFVRFKTSDPDIFETTYCTASPPQDVPHAAMFHLSHCQTVTTTTDGRKIIVGDPTIDFDVDDEEAPAERRNLSKVDLFVSQRQITPVGRLTRLTVNDSSPDKTGPLGPIEYLSVLKQSEVLLYQNETLIDDDGSKTTVYYAKQTSGSDVLRPGNHPTFKGIRSDKLTDKLNFLSLMLALFGGTASLPHILIRYYTVKDQASARKSTIVGIASIGFFYVLTLYIGLGAMTSGALDVTNSNMAAPLLAKSFSNWLFAIISAIAFTTVLGTVSGLIIAASGAVAHDICGTLLKMEMTDYQKIRIAKIASVVVGLIAIVLGILFEKMNVSYLVGWAFSVAASANLPSLIMLIFWKGTTKQGITAAITVGLISSLSWILLSADTFKDVYGIDPAKAFVPFSQPGIVTIPLGFAVLIGVSLLTRRREIAA